MNSESQDNTILKVINLRKEFGGLIAVKDVSFEIKKGEFTPWKAEMVKKLSTRL